jgi:hypothetical protein
MEGVAQSLLLWLTLSRCRLALKVGGANQVNVSAIVGQVATILCLEPVRDLESVPFRTFQVRGVLR